MTFGQCSLGVKENLNLLDMQEKRNLNKSHLWSKENPNLSNLFTKENPDMSHYLSSARFALLNWEVLRFKKKSV